MHVEYDHNIKIAGIGMVPWTRLGLERWLPQYAIASYYGWDMPASQPPRVVALSDHHDPLPALPKLNSPSLLREPAFQQLLSEELSDYALMTYKPVDTPPELSSRRFLMPGTSFSDIYENKATFRELFADKVTMPPFKIYDRNELTPDEAAFHRLMAGRRRMVIQDERLAGGRGSHIVADFGQYVRALSDIDSLSAHKRVVVSDFIDNAKERSIQCCVTADTVLTGPLQRQIIRHPLIANLLTPDGDKFCGAQICAADQSTPLHAEMTEAARTIGRDMQQAGYRGIFGVDFLVDESGKLFVLEVNPRITGVTPLLTAMYRPGDIPFYLLHVLELGGYEHRLTGVAAPMDRDGSLIVMHNLDDHEMRFGSIPRSGTYRLDGRLTGDVKGSHKLIRVSDNIRLTELRPDEFIIQGYMPPGIRIKIGGRLAILQFPTAVLDEATDKLLPQVVRAIAAVRTQVKLVSPISANAGLVDNRGIEER